MTDRNSILDHLRRVLNPAGEGGLTDGQLLARFIASREEAAFAALVRRHGPMVWRLCLRVLGHVQDAEDAFQATFLVLARKAGAVVKRESVGSFLYGVAYRIAHEAKSLNDRRRSREKQLDNMPHPAIPPLETQVELDHQLNLLPEHYRTVIVACDLEGMSRKEAARHLGLSEGTLSSRLARGRRLLAKRLSRTGAAVVAAFADNTVSAHIPASLLSSTTKVAAGQTFASSVVEILVKGALKTMLLTKLKVAVGTVMVMVALGASGLAYRASGRSASPAADPPTELDVLRKEVELLKVKMDVVQQKLRLHDTQLRNLQKESAGGAKNRARAESSIATLMLEIENLRAREQEYGRRYQNQVSSNRRNPGTIPHDTLMETHLAYLKYRAEKEVKQKELSQAKAQQARDIDIAVKAWLNAADKEAEQRAVEALEKAVKKLREQQDNPGGPIPFDGLQR
ncbi:MAG TPA: RNA polymerase sigma factor [Gemmataceae bacterium]|nr:RNA polymerase sigma factor [Gemmataceae bacterium]